MSIKAIVASRLAALYTSEWLLVRNRATAERRRQRKRQAHMIDLFIDPADPYGYLLLELMPAFAARYEVHVQPWLVGDPEDAVAPDRERLAGWSIRDCAMLAARMGIAPPVAALPAADRIAQTRAIIAAAIGQDGALQACTDVMMALWTGASLPSAPHGDVAAAIAQGNARRAEAGHYLGSVLAYGGESYWGVDRLHFLEARLKELGLRRDGKDAPLYPPPPDMAGPVSRPRGGELHWYLSFRSPYTWLATNRVKAIADAHGAELKLRFVLPMVMRSLPVPPVKRRYITRDAAREARRFGIPFGKICDPVGEPVERGYSLLPWAREQGRGFAYVESFLRNVWSEGIDAGSDAGLQRIVEQAGLDWSDARRFIGNDGWRVEAEANRQELLSLGHWGVPSFRVGDTAVWGQDRLWAVDAALRS
jgi:2-hydroxychromene-2-carboxylate isomerase